MKKKKKASAVQKKNKKKKSKVRLPLSLGTLKVIGVKALGMRQIYHDVMVEVEKSAPKMKRLITALDDAHNAAKQVEETLANYAMQFYPDGEWPKTFAYWRQDLRRINFDK